MQLRKVRDIANTNYTVTESTVNHLRFKTALHTSTRLRKRPSHSSSDLHPLTSPSPQVKTMATELDQSLDDIIKSKKQSRGRGRGSGSGRGAGPVRRSGGRGAYRQSPYAFAQASVR